MGRQKDVEAARKYGLLEEALREGPLPIPPSLTPSTGRRASTPLPPPPRPSMARHKDVEIAKKYRLPVEALREGLPKVLHEAPDHKILPGNLMRVSTASGLQIALSRVEVGDDPIQVFIVPYMAPLQADLIREFLKLDCTETTKEEKDEAAFVWKKLGIDERNVGGDMSQADGTPPGPRAAARGGRVRVARGGRDVVIANPQVLWSKQLALMSIRGEKEIISSMRDQLLNNPNLYPHEVTQLPTPEDNLGLSDAKNLKRLKESYLAANISSDPQIALNILKQTDKILFVSVQATRQAPDRGRETCHDYRSGK